MTHPNVTLEDILDALMTEEPEPTYEALTRWSQRYPEYGEALANFFATWAVQAELPQEISANQERLANLAVSHALDIVHRRDQTVERAPKTSGARPRLIAAARAVGISEEQLAIRSGLDSTIIEKLDVRRISTGVPRICYERIATALGTVTDHIREMTTGPPLLAAGTRHKAKRKPVPTTEDFADAIRNSSLSEQAKRFWLEAVAADQESSEK